MKLSWESIRQASVNTTTASTTLATAATLSAFSSGTSVAKDRNSVSGAKKDPSPLAQPTPDKRQSPDLSALSGPTGTERAKDGSSPHEAKKGNEFDDFITQQNPQKNIWQIGMLVVKYVCFPFSFSFFPPFFSLFFVFSVASMAFPHLIENIQLEFLDATRSVRLHSNDGMHRDLPCFYSSFSRARS
jgi:hypothetical protein